MDVNSAATDFAMAISLLARRVRAESGTRDLTWAMRAVIRRLSEEGPATTSDLARAERMKPQSMGAIAAALEQMGLVVRKPHPTDRRQMFILLTPAGEIYREETRAARIAWLTQAMSSLSKEEQNQLFSAIPVMKSLAEK